VNRTQAKYQTNTDMHRTSSITPYYSICSKYQGLEGKFTFTLCKLYCNSEINPEKKFNYKWKNQFTIMCAYLATWLRKSDLDMIVLWKGGKNRG